MEKLKLYVKKYWYWVLLALGGLLYLAFLVVPRRTVGFPGEKPKAPEKVKAPDFFQQLLKAKEENDARIKNLSRRDFIDELNSDASRRGKS